MPVRTRPRLYDVAGEARRLHASPLFSIGPAAPGPALRRGALVAVPIARSQKSPHGEENCERADRGSANLLASQPNRSRAQAATAGEETL